MNLLNCDGCGSVIRQNHDEAKSRLRVNRYEPGQKSIFDLGPSDGWDFCSLGCLATWAADQEIQQSAPKPEAGP